jgi:hypothetical protein
MLPLLGIPLNIRARHDPHPIHSVFDTHLFVFLTEAIRIRICIRDYPNSNPIRNVKVDRISTISVSDLFTSLVINLGVCLETALHAHYPKHIPTNVFRRKKKERHQADITTYHVGSLQTLYGRRDIQ